MLLHIRSTIREGTMVGCIFQKNRGSGERLLVNVKLTEELLTTLVGVKGTLNS